MLLLILLNSFIVARSYLLLHNDPILSTKMNFNLENPPKFGTKITLIRHANTYNNQNNICTGEIDAPIIKPATKKQMGNYDLVLSSTALRCRQTLDFLEFKNKPKIIFDDSFLEAGYGSLTGKYKKDFNYKRDFFNKPPESDLYNSESIFEAGVRSYFGFTTLADRYLENEFNILVLSHKNTLKGLWSLLNVDDIIYSCDSIEIDDIEDIVKNKVNLKNIPKFDNLQAYNILL
jgi:broad specificity phosphatase PhoE